MEIQKIALDQTFTQICKILQSMRLKGMKQYVFYNSQDGKSMNIETIFKLVYFLEKYISQAEYKFYNVPFCVFKKFWKEI